MNDQQKNLNYFNKTSDNEVSQKCCILRLTLKFYHPSFNIQ